MERTYERNLLLDTGDHALSKKGCRLRLRQNGEQKIITFKRTEKLENGIAYREEIESDFSDFENMQLIFTRLGYEPIFVYEKYRSVFQLRHTNIMVDETPLGNFVEIEGPDEAAIRAVSDMLGLDWDSRTELSYQALFTRLADERQFCGKNMLFADLS